MSCSRMWAFSLKKQKQKKTEVYHDLLLLSSSFSIFYFYFLDTMNISADNACLWMKKQNRYDDE